MDSCKPVIKEVIVVEGRDDTCAVKQAVVAQTIETHGFGIRQSTWDLIKKAYEGPGIIVFTDPDFAGEAIRRRLLERFPDAKEAYLSRAEATKNEDIGIENAQPGAIIEALSKAHCTKTTEQAEFSREDLQRYGLSGGAGSVEKREKMGAMLGIGYGNGNAFLQKLNKYGITRKEFESCLGEIQK